MSQDGLEQRLDLLIALTRIGIRDQLTSAERRIATTPSFRPSSVTSALRTP